MTKLSVTFPLFLGVASIQAFALEPAPPEGYHRLMVAKPGPVSRISEAPAPFNSPELAAEPDAASGFSDAPVPVKPIEPLIAPVAVPFSFEALDSDKTYENVLVRWAGEAGWRLSWEMESGYRFNYPANFGPDFLKAVDKLCASLNASGVRARAFAYEENRVLRIVSEGTSQ